MTKLMNPNWVESTTARAPREASELEAMAERLGRLEGSHRRWKLAGVGLASCLVVLLGVAAAHLPGTIEAEHFVVKDRAGAVRAELAVGPDNMPGLSFFDNNGKPTLTLGLNKDAKPGINLFDPEGTLRAACAVRPDGTPGLCLVDRRGNIKLSLDLSDNGSSGINLYSENGALRAALAIRPDGTPGVGLFDEQGNVVRTFEVERDAARDPGGPTRPNPAPGK